MNKAKIAVAAIALFATIGGALAFKAQKFQPANAWTVYAVNAQGVSYCSLDVDKRITLVPPGQNAFVATTTAQFNVCVDLQNTLVTDVD